MKRALPLFFGLFGVWLLGCSSNSVSPTTPTPTPSPPTASPPTAPETPAPTPPPPPAPPPQPETLRTAMFQNANGYRTSGGASIVREGDAHRLELGRDFRTDDSAALDVRLCRNSSCTGGDLNLGTLKSARGRQSYDLPNAARAYSHVVIWCRAVRLAFGFGALR